MLKHAQTGTTRPLEGSISPSNEAIDFMCHPHNPITQHRPPKNPSRLPDQIIQNVRTGNYSSDSYCHPEKGQLTLQSCSLNSSPCSSYVSSSSSSAYSSLDAGDSADKFIETNFSKRWRPQAKKDTPAKAMSVILNVKEDENLSSKYGYPSLPNCGELEAVGQIITRIRILDHNDNSQKVSIQNSLNTRKSSELSVKSSLLKHEAESEATRSRSKTSSSVPSKTADCFPVAERKSVPESKTKTYEYHLRSRSCDSRSKYVQEGSRSLSVPKPSRPSISEKFSGRDKICLGKSEKPLRRIVHFDDEDINKAWSPSSDPSVKKRVEIKKNENDDLTYVNVDEIGQKRTLSGVLHRSFRSGRSFTRSIRKSLRRSEHFKRPPIGHQRFDVETRNGAQNSKSNRDFKCTVNVPGEASSKRQRSLSDSRGKNSSRTKEISVQEVKGDSLQLSKSRSIFRTSLKRSFRKKSKRANSIAKDFKVETGSNFRTEDLNSGKNDDNNNKKKAWNRLSFIGTKKDRTDAARIYIDVSHYDVPKPLRKKKTSSELQPNSSSPSNSTDLAETKEINRRIVPPDECKASTRDLKQFCSTETLKITTEQRKREEGISESCGEHRARDDKRATNANVDWSTDPAVAPALRRVSGVADDTKKLAVRVWVRCLLQDMEYKTLHVTPHTTAAEVVSTILSKFRMKHRDPNLFYLALEVVISNAEGPTSTTVPLSDTARPSALLECQPSATSRLTLRMRRGGVIRIHDAVLAQGSRYKSLLVSGKSDCVQIIGLVLACNHLSECSPEDYVLVQITRGTGIEIRLLPHDRPLAVVQGWPCDDHADLHIRAATEQPSRPLSPTTSLAKSRLSGDLETCLGKDVPDQQKHSNSFPDVVGIETRSQHNPSDTKRAVSDCNGRLFSGCTKSTFSGCTKSTFSDCNGRAFSDCSGAKISSCTKISDEEDLKNIYEVCGVEDEGKNLYSNGEFLEKVFAGRRLKAAVCPPSPPSRAPSIPSRRKGVPSLSPDLLEATATDGAPVATGRRPLSYNDYENYFYI